MSGLRDKNLNLNTRLSNKKIREKRGSANEMERQNKKKYNKNNKIN